MKLPTSSFFTSEFLIWGNRIFRMLELVQSISSTSFPSSSLTWTCPSPSRTTEDSPPPPSPLSSPSLSSSVSPATPSSCLTKVQLASFVSAAKPTDQGTLSVLLLLVVGGGTIFGYPSAVFGGVFKSCQIVLYPPQVTSKEVCSERCVEQ